MNKSFFEEVGLYCSLATEVVLLAFDEEQATMLGEKGYAIHPAYCSRYAECGCKHYGLAAECKSILKQAEAIIRDERRVYTQHQ